MFRKVLSLFALLVLVAAGFGATTGTVSAAPKPTATSPGPTPTPTPATPISIYGAWHCGNDACLWATVRNMTQFDQVNHWLIDRGDGSGKPSVNVVILSFVNPLKLLNKTNDAGTVNGVPIGMNASVVNYFASKGIRVMLSIGGITFVNDWNTALATNGHQLGLNAAAVAQQLGVGIEIDYEENNNPNLTQLQAFIDGYRLVLPYDATGNNHAARLTIDLGAGNRWLVPLNQKASADWLRTSNPVLDYANAMVPNRQPSTSGAISNWSEHVNGYLSTTPLAPAKFTGSLFLVPNTGSGTLPECTDFNTSLQKSTGNFVQTVAPNGSGTTAGMLGYMFWAAECQGRGTCTTPPNTCEGGMGAAAAFYNIPIPLPALRQQ
jgi:hypothetical protein